MKTTDNEKGGNLKSAGGLGFQLFQDLFSIEN